MITVPDALVNGTAVCSWTRRSTTMKYVLAPERDDPVPEGGTRLRGYPESLEETES